MLNQVIKPNIEMQINLTIGKRKFFLQIQKNSNIIQKIDKFLIENNLDHKYQTPILDMVHQDLQKKQNKIHEKTPKQPQHKSHKTQHKQQQQKNTNFGNNIKNDTKQNEGNLQNYKTQANNNGQQSQQGEKQACMNVYEKWKKKQKEKQQNRMNKNKPTHKKINLDKNKVDKKIEVHQPAYFYERGMGFQKQKQTHRQELFHKHYPFSTKQITLTPRQKQQVHERLYSQYKNKQSQKIISHIRQLDRKNASKSPYNDHIKQKVKKRDEQIDKAVNILLKNGMIDNPYKINRTSKSPFRRTVLN